MANILCYERIKLTKPTNALRLSKEPFGRRISVYLMHEDRAFIKSLKVKSLSSNKIILSETVNPETIEHKYMRECVGNYLNPLGKTIRKDIFVEVFYETCLTIQEVAIRF